MVGFFTAEHEVCRTAHRRDYAAEAGPDERDDAPVRHEAAQQRLLHVRTGLTARRRLRPRLTDLRAVHIVQPAANAW